MKKVAVNGPFSSRTGIGVVQKELYPRLMGQGYRLETVGPSVSERSGKMPRLRLIRTLLALPRRTQVFLCVASPIPLVVPATTVSVVHDLRWLDTRGGLARLYRHWDLARIVRRSSWIVCVSETTRQAMIRMFPDSEHKSSVSWLGPGLAGGTTFTPQRNGRLIIVGGAAHKRNELLARVLRESRPSWVKEVVGVGLSPEAAETLREAFGSAYEHRGRVSDSELRRLYEESEYFAHFGVREGFGMPYIEALAAGCQVVAIDQPLTREILGDAATLVSDISEESLTKAFTVPPFVDHDIMRRHVQRFSWEHFSASIAFKLDEVAVRSRS